MGFESFGGQQDEDIEAVKTPDQMGSVELFNLVRDEMCAEWNQLLEQNGLVGQPDEVISARLSGPESDALRGKMREVASLIKNKQAENPSDVVLNQAQSILSERYLKIAPNDRPLFDQV